MEDVEGSGADETDEDDLIPELEARSDFFSLSATPMPETRSAQVKCRPRPKIDCQTTQFGCCSDGVLAAKGPFQQGRFLYFFILESFPNCHVRGS